MTGNGSTKTLRPPLSTLIVEDDPKQICLVKEVLFDADQAIILQEAHTLRDAISIATERKFDAALLDLQLPDSHGLETFLRFSRHLPHVAVIVYSGSVDDALATETLRFGAEDYISKDEIAARYGTSLARAIRNSVQRHVIIEANEPLRRAREILSLLSSASVNSEISE